jgi:hypothetical protein
MASEQTIQQEIRLACSNGPTRLFRNNVGRLPDPRTSRWVEFGVGGKGAGDLLGWRTVTITPEMVGTTVAVFLSIEVKTATGRLRPEQQQWLDAVQAAGGIAGVARSVEDAQRLTMAAGGGTLREPQTESHDDHDTCIDRSAAATADHHPAMGHREH